MQVRGFLFCVGRCLNSSLLTVVIIIVLLHIFHGKSPQKTRQPAPQPPSSDNGTYQDDTDREAIQLEVDALKSEIDRISTATEYNGMQLLDGSLAGAGGNNTNYGAKYGVIGATDDDLKSSIVTSSIAGVTVNTTVGAASGKGGEFAAWDAAGTTLTINLVENETYTQKDIDALIAKAEWNKNEGQTGTPADVTLTLKNGVMTATKDSTSGKTVAGKRTTGSESLLDLMADGTNGNQGTADQITFTANTYGGTDGSKTAAVIKITVNTAGVERGKEGVEETATAGEIKLNLATGVDYTEKDIENILAKEGYDFSVKLEDATAVITDGDKDGVIRFSKAASKDVNLTAGQGVGKDDVSATGTGLTFQIGANGVEDQRVTLNVDDMGASALGVADADVSTQAAANKAIEMVDSAVKTVSMQRAALGAMQNRLEYTVNNLTTTGENLTNAESQIRDTDMATEMINYTKFNILQQASQAMLAQANQQPQAVLQLLG